MLPLTFTSSGKEGKCSERLYQSCRPEPNLHKRLVEEGKVV